MQSDFKDLKDVVENYMVKVVNNNTNLIINGPAGCGKNWLAKQVAEKAGKPYHIIETEFYHNYNHVLRNVYAEVKEHADEIIIFSIAPEHLTPEVVNATKAFFDKGECNFVDRTSTIRFNFTGNVILTTNDLNEQDNMHRALIARAIKVDLPINFGGPVTIVEKSEKPEVVIWGFPTLAIHTTTDGIETNGSVLEILPNEYPVENRTWCIFKPEDGPQLEVYLDEIKLPDNA